ncbi:MAG: 50S ribosomal protein L6, partial [bacterium]
MSRIGKRPISIPSGVEVSLDGNTVRVKGPLGSMEKIIPMGMIVKKEGNTIIVDRPSDDKLYKSLH